MKITTKGRYALRVVIDLASQENGEYISLKDISERQNISAKYLETIIAILNKGGLVESLRGKNGGYRLAKPPEEISAGSVLRLTEGSLSPVSCIEPANLPCPRADICPTLDFWKGLDTVINSYTDSISIASLNKKKFFE